MNYQPIEKIHLAFVGCGRITQRHAKTIEKLNRKSNYNIQLSFASRSPNKADTYHKKYGGRLAFGSYASAIASTDVNVVMINTPPSSHQELVEAALKAGKHVIVEKPPFLNTAEMEALGQLAEENGLQLLVAENYYYKPLREKLKEVLHSGDIGAPLFIHINATKKRMAKHDWRDDPTQTGLGALFEGGIHWINLLNHIGLTITDVQGFMPPQLTELDRSIQIVAKTQEGPIINLLYSWEVDTLFKGLRLSKVHGRAGSITFETNGIFLFVRGKRSRMTLPGLAHIQGFQPMFEDFFGALQQGRIPQFDWRMAKADLAMIETIYRTVG